MSYDSKDISLLKALANGYDLLEDGVPWRDQIENYTSLAMRCEELGDGVGAIVYGLIGGWIALASGATIEEIQEVFFDGDEVLRKAHAVVDATTFPEPIRILASEVLREGTLEAGIRGARLRLLEGLGVSDGISGQMTSVMMIAEMKFVNSLFDDAQIATLVLDALEIADECDEFKIKEDIGDEKTRTSVRASNLIKTGKPTSAIVLVYFDVVMGVNAGVYPLSLLEKASDILGPFIAENVGSPSQEVSDFMESLASELSQKLSDIFNLEEEEEED